MLITRKTKIPVHWVFYAQIPFVMAIAANYATGAPFLYAVKKFIDNPAAITFLISIEVTITVLGGPFASWLSDRVWTKYGRRKIFIVISNIPQAAAVMLMPFAPTLMWLLILKWTYGIFGDIGTPNQALTMEVVPAKQRGLGSGFFKSQINLVNLVFFWCVFGRLDDVYFTGPFQFLTQVPGDVLVFVSGGILLLAICFFTFYGIHEVKPPNRKTIEDERKPGENLIKTFVRSFFKDVLGKDLLPLYLLLVVGTLTTVGLGILGPLLYTEQWGYSKQEMGNNVAIGALYGIVLSIFSGWIADRTSKMTVYAWALILGLIAKIAWTYYVYLQPAFRPSLLEIIVFGNIQFTFGTLAGVVSFPLILEYVERNRLGTAGAGMGLFSGLIKNGFTMAVGPYILVWSFFFLPQAGNRLQVVFENEKSTQDVTALLSDKMVAVEMDELEVAPVYRFGEAGDQTSHWKIRRPIEGAGDLHKRVKDLVNEIAALNTKSANPLLDADEKAAFAIEIAEKREEMDRIEEELDASAADFEKEMLDALEGTLAINGGQIIDVKTAPPEGKVLLTLRIVEPVTGDISEDLRAAMGQFQKGLDFAELSRRPTDQPGIYAPVIEVVPIEEPDNGLEITFARDPDFVALEEAIFNAGFDSTGPAGYLLIGDLLLSLRGSVGQSTDYYDLSEIFVENAEGSVERDDGIGEENLVRMSFALTINRPESDLAAPVDAAALQDLFGAAGSVESAEVTGEFPDFFVKLEIEKLDPVVSGQSAIAERVDSLLPEANLATVQSIEALYERIEAALASKPYYLNTKRPVIAVKADDREYDYFFSVQYFMIITDIFGIAVIGLILYLERRGTIIRKGALEDEVRESTT